MQADDPEAAQAQFIAADQFYRRSPGTDLHRAHVAVHLASNALAEGRTSDALALLDRYQGVAERHENAGLLATLLMLRADALRSWGGRRRRTASGWTVWDGRVTASDHWRGYPHRGAARQAQEPKG